MTFHDWLFLSRDCRVIECLSVLVVYLLKAGVGKNEVRREARRLLLIDVPKSFIQAPRQAINPAPDLLKEELRLVLPALSWQSLYCVLYCAVRRVRTLPGPLEPWGRQLTCVLGQRHGTNKYLKDFIGCCS